MYLDAVLSYRSLKMKRLLFLILLIQPMLGCEPKSSPTQAFSFHLFMEPQHLDPARSRASSASYFFYNTLRGIYKIDANNRPVEEGGRCEWVSDTQLICHLNDDKWSNGDPVVAEDYIRSFQHLLAPSTGSPRAHLLKFVKGSDSVLQGQASSTSLAVKATDSKTLVIDFVKRDREFFYKLASTALYPTHRNHDADKKSYADFIVNGPYQVTDWSPGKMLRLKPNPQYQRGHPDRPPLEIHFIDDELTAFRLYEKKQLTFLRRIPSQLIPSLQNRDDFFQQPMLRFDYIGFGENLMQQPALRAALVQSVDYEKLKLLLGALERPGCPSIPKQWLVKQKCHNFDIEAAKQQLLKVSPEARATTYQLKVSQLGGNDIKKQAEFLQNQWKTHLGLDIQISQVEQTTFLNELRSSPPDIFRKGVGLDRPTCMNALETFSSDSRQNYIDLDASQYQKWVEEMSRHEVLSPTYKKLCQKAVDFLLDDNRLIPLGEMHFTLMASPAFQGWTLNGMNQLDLSQIHSVSPK